MTCYILNRKTHFSSESYCCLFSCIQRFCNCLKFVVLFLIAVLPVLLHHVRLLAAVLDVLIYLVLPRWFTDIMDFRKARAFCPCIPEHKIQRDLMEYNASLGPCLPHNEFSYYQNLGICAGGCLCILTFVTDNYEYDNG